MKKTIVTILLLAGLLTTQAQPLSMEKAFRGQKNCVDIELTALSILPQLYQQRQFDSMALALDYVALTCVEMDMLRMSRFLLDIQYRRLSDTAINSHDIFVLKRQSRYLRQKRQDGAADADWWQTLTGQSSASSFYFDRKRLTEAMMNMLWQWRNELLQREGLTGLERSVLHHLRLEEDPVEVGRNLFNEASRPAYRQSPLRKAYRQYHENHVINRAWYIGGGYGRWLQQGSARPYYGNQPGLHLSAGRMMSRATRLGLHIMGRFGTAARPFGIKRPDTAFWANKVSVTAVGLEVVRTVWRPNTRWALGVLLGAGMEHRRFFDDLPQNDEVAGEPNDVLNAKMGQSYGNRYYGLAGLEWEYFVTSGLALTLSSRYQFGGGFDSYIGTGQANGGVLMVQAGLAVYLVR
jgi:hypothetical protein